MAYASRTRTPKESVVRKDMFKVIVERPRRGARLRINRARFTGDEALPSRVSMKRFRKINRTETKCLNENLAPLKRFLMKQVGRPWNKVYSEICEHLDANNTVKQHVRDHLKDFIVIKVAIGRDGEWMNGNEWPGWRGCGTLWHQPLYVDPNDGLIKRSDKLWKKLGIEAKRWKRKQQAAADPNIRKIDADRALHRIGGIWYEIKFGKRINARSYDSTFDKLTGKAVWPGRRHAKIKRQLSANELAGLGLQNDV